MKSRSRDGLAAKGLFHFSNCEQYHQKDVGVAIFTPFYRYRKRVWSSVLVLKETETQEGVLITTVKDIQKKISPVHDVNIYSLCIWIWPVQFKLHIIQAHRLPLTFFELLEPNLVVLIKLQFGFLLCSDLWLSFWRSNSYRNEVKTNEKSTIPHFTIK